MSRKSKLPPIAQGWREQAQKRTEVVTRTGDGFGMAFQLPPGWDDGSGKIRHMKGGVHDGRIIFSSRREAKDIARRWEDACGRRVEYDP